MSIPGSSRLRRAFFRACMVGPATHLRGNALFIDGAAALVKKSIAVRPSCILARVILYIYGPAPNGPAVCLVWRSRAVSGVPPLRLVMRPHGDPCAGSGRGAGLRGPLRIVPSPHGVARVSCPRVSLPEGGAGDRILRCRERFRAMGRMRWCHSGPPAEGGGPFFCRGEIYGRGERFASEEIRLVDERLMIVSYRATISMT